MVIEIGGTNSKQSASRTLRCSCCGHTVRISIRGTVPINGCLCDGQAAFPAPNIMVEDLGYGYQTKVVAGTFPPKHLGEQAVPAELPGTNDPFAGRGYQAARGCAPRPEGAPSAEEAIALGRGQHPDAVLSAAGQKAVVDEAIRAAGGKHHEGADPPLAVSLAPSWGWSCSCGGRNHVKTGLLVDVCVFCDEKSRIPEGALTVYQATRRPTEPPHA